MNNLSDDEELIRDHDEERKGLLGEDLHDEEEDFFLQGPRMGQHIGSGGANLAAGVQKQVQEVTSIMRDNVNRMLDRGERLDDLERRSDSLNDASSEFRNSSNRMAKQMWWKNTKAKAAIGGSVAFVIVIIIIIASL